MRVSNSTHRTSDTARRFWVKAAMLEYQLEKLESEKTHPDYVENQRNA
jgi:hypothetical protein